MWYLDPVNILLHWLGLGCIFLFLTYIFRDRVSVEGFLGYVLLLFLLIPVNVVGGAITHTAQIAIQHPILFVGMQLAANAVLIVLWCKCLYGLVASSIISLLLFAIFFSLLAFCMQLAPPIPFHQFFPLLAATQQ